MSAIHERLKEYEKLGLAPETVRQYLGRVAWRRRTKIEQRGNFDEKYPEDAITAFLTSGKNYFDRDILIARKLELVGFRPWKEYGRDREAKIFHQRIATRRYLIGADPATGRQISTEDTDYAAAVVLDLETGEELASYRARVTPEDLAYDLADLGRYFNDAIIGVERTGDGGTTILTLNGECRYGNIFKYKEWFKRRREKLIEWEGFPTTPKTRPVALNFLNKFILDHPELIWDAQFIQEALTFVRDEKGKPAAAEGCHDDTVSARWIAHMMRRVLLGWFDPTAPMTRQTYIPSERLPAEEEAVA